MRLALGDVGRNRDSVCEPGSGPRLKERLGKVNTSSRLRASYRGGVRQFFQDFKTQEVPDDTGMHINMG